MTISTAPWAAIYSDIWTSRKLKQLKRTLGISAEQAVGHLLRLWHACLTSAPVSGELEGWTALDVAEAANWPEHDAQRWTDALLDAGWLDHNDVCDFVLHEWQGYGGSFLVSKEAGRRRKAKWREEQSRGRPSDVPGTEQGQGDGVPGTSHTTSPNLTSPDLTRPNQTREQPNPPPAVQRPRRKWGARTEFEMAEWAESPDDLLKLPMSLIGKHFDLDTPPPAGQTFGAFLSARFLAYDGTDGRPRLLTLIKAKWEPLDDKFNKHGPRGAYNALLAWLGDGYHRALGAWQRAGNVDPAAFNGKPKAQPLPSTGIKYRPVEPTDV